MTLASRPEVAPGKAAPRGVFTHRTIPHLICNARRYLPRTATFALTRDTQGVGGSWLYVRGRDSIRIMRSDRGFRLVVQGPREMRQYFDFVNDDERQDFQSTIEGELVAAGWVELGQSDRRQGLSNNRIAAREIASDRRRV